MNISLIAISLTLLLIGVGILAILAGGVRTISMGKSDLKKLGAFGVPFIVFGISYAIMGSLNEAGIATMLFMMGVMIIMIVTTGLRGTFKF
jgi:hypothetical protein